MVSSSTQFLLFRIRLIEESARLTGLDRDSLAAAIEELSDSGSAESALPTTVMLATLDASLQALSTEFDGSNFGALSRVVQRISTDADLPPEQVQWAMAAWGSVLRKDIEFPLSWFRLEIGPEIQPDIEDQPGLAGC